MSSNNHFRSLGNPQIAALRLYNRQKDQHYTENKKHLQKELDDNRQAEYCSYMEEENTKLKLNLASLGYREGIAKIQIHNMQNLQNAINRASEHLAEMRLLNRRMRYKADRLVKFEKSANTDAATQASPKTPEPEMSNNSGNSSSGYSNTVSEEYSPDKVSASWPENPFSSPK